MKVQAAACLVLSYSKVKTSWATQHVFKNQTSLGRKIWAKMTEEQPSLAKAGDKRESKLWNVSLGSEVRELFPEWYGLTLSSKILHFHDQITPTTRSAG